MYGELKLRLLGEYDRCKGCSSEYMDNHRRELQQMLSSLYLIKCLTDEDFISLNTLVSERFSSEWMV